MYLSYMKPRGDEVVRCDHEIKPDDYPELVQWFADWYSDKYPGEAATRGRAGWYQRFLEFLSTDRTGGFWITILNNETPLDEQYWSDLIDPILRPLRK